MQVPRHRRQRHRDHGPVELKQGRRGRAGGEPDPGFTGDRHALRAVGGSAPPAAHAALWCCACHRSSMAVGAIDRFAP